MEGKGEALLAGLIHKKSSVVKEEGAGGRGQGMKGWRDSSRKPWWGVGKEECRGCQAIRIEFLSHCPHFKRWGGVSSCERGVRVKPDGIRGP